MSQAAHVTGGGRKSATAPRQSDPRQSDPKQSDPKAGPLPPRSGAAPHGRPVPGTSMDSTRCASDLIQSTTSLTSGRGAALAWTSQ
jgi:hypothetical protein